MDEDHVDDVAQAVRILRSWAGERQRRAGKWTTQDQAAIDCAVRLEQWLIESPTQGGENG